MRKRVFSQLLDRMLPLSLTTHTLRCIDKAGGALPNALRGLALGLQRLTRAAASAGLDEYVLNARESELGTGVGPALRLELLMAMQERQAKAAAAAAAAKAPKKE